MSAAADIPSCQRHRLIPATDGHRRALVWRRRAWRAFRLYGLLLVLVLGVMRAGYWTQGCGPGVVLVLLEDGRVVECR